MAHHPLTALIVAAAVEKQAALPAFATKGLGAAAGWLGRRAGNVSAVGGFAKRHPVAATVGAAAAVPAAYGAREAVNEISPSPAARFNESNQTYADRTSQFMAANDKFRAGEGPDPGAGRFERTWVGRQLYGTPTYTAEQRQAMHGQNLAKMRAGNFYTSPFQFFSGGWHRDRAIAAADQLSAAPQYTGGILPTVLGRDQLADPEAMRQFLMKYRDVSRLGGDAVTHPMGRAPIVNGDAYLRGRPRAGGQIDWSSVYAGK